MEQPGIPPPPEPKPGFNWVKAILIGIAVIGGVTLISIVIFLGTCFLMVKSH